MKISLPMKLEAKVAVQLSLDKRILSPLRHEHATATFPTSWLPEARQLTNGSTSDNGNLALLSRSRHECDGFLRWRFLRKGPMNIGILC